MAEHTTMREGEMAEATVARRPTRCAPQAGHRCDEIAQLTQRAAAGDQAAWNELINRYSRLLWSIAGQHRPSPADAADVFQTTWMRLVENIDRIADPERVGAWLATTARRECLRHIRLRARELPAVDDAVFDTPTHEPVETGLLTRERNDALRRAFSGIGDRCQALLRMLAAGNPSRDEELGAAPGMRIGA